MSAAPAPVFQAGPSVAGDGVILRTVEPAPTLSRRGSRHLKNLARSSAAALTFNATASPTASPTATTTPTPTSAGLHIVLKEGPKLKANPQAQAAFRRAAAFIESLFSDPVTIVVDAEVAPLAPGIIGQTASSQFHFAKSPDFDRVRALMVKDAASDESVVGRLPTLSQFKYQLPKDTTGAGAFSFAGLTATRANLLALGMKPADLTAAPDSDYDPSVKRDMSMTFSSNFAFDYDRSDGVAAGKMDFTGLVIHELAHGLGFLSEVDEADNLTDLPGFDRGLWPSTLDLFRLKPGAGAANFTTATRVLAPGDQAPYQVTYDGGVYDPAGKFAGIPGLTRGDVPMSTGVGHGDGKQASHWKDNDLTGTYIGAMDPTTSYSTQVAWTAADTRALGLIGWNVASSSAPATTTKTASLSGVAFVDANGNGTRDAGEAGRSGVTVWLDKNDNGKVDTGETSTKTDAAGAYRFGGLAAGAYNVRCVAPAGTTATAPKAAAYRVTLANGQNAGGLNFGSKASTVVPANAAGWTSTDLGNVNPAGSSTVSGTGPAATFTLKGAGTDIFGLADDGQFDYQTLAGDGEIVARVTAVGNTDPFSKAGVMVRQGPAANAKNVYLCVTRSNGLRLTARAAAGGSTDSTAAAGAAPQWLRLVRSGSKFTAYKSPDGSHWTPVGARTVSMTGDVLVGLAVTSHHNGDLNTNTFDNVRITRAAASATTRLSAPVTAPVTAPTTPSATSPKPVEGFEDREYLQTGIRSDGGVPWA